MRITKIGGQAVIEGIMMRGNDMYSLAVRNLEGEIIVEEKELDKKFSTGFWKLPIIRGFVTFINSLVFGTKILNRSMELSGLEEIEGEPSKFEIWLSNIFKDNFTKVITGFSFVLAMFISLGLFVYLPIFVTNLIVDYFGEGAWLRSLFEGIFRMIIFILYLYLISKSKDIQRVFMYHGAEHKTIACFEAEEELTVENARKHSRFHKRCGTSFLFLVMFISIVFFMFVHTDVILYRFLYKVLLLPVLSGVSYEVLRFAGNHDNFFINLISYPGLKLQHLTTKEPDDMQLEVAIAAMKKVLEHQEI
ncbi:MAG: DUF1385 domain-containing protein [Lachnospirales bacterium]